MSDERQPQPTTPHQETTQQQPPTDDPKDNPSQDQHQQPHQSTPPQQGTLLRSGKILPVINSQVSLDKYLENILEKARESQGVSIPQCDALEKRLNKAREERLTKINKFKEDTERFKQELLDFGRFSRSFTLEDKENKSVSEVRNNKSDRLSSDSLSSENCVGESSVEEVVIEWLGNSLLESSLDDSNELKLIFSSPKAKANFKMVDYTKVAKLMAQMVPLFSGEPSPKLSLELQTFLGCCRQVQQCLNEEEKTAFLQMFSTRLRGGAYQLFSSSIPSSFKEVEDILNRTYLPRETYQELVNKLITIRQNPLEALTAFTTRVKQLTMLCFEAAETKYGATAAPAVKTQLEDFAKNAIRSGVTNPHLCQFLLTLGEESLDTLIHKALDMERLQQGALLFQPNLPNSPLSSPTLTHTPYINNTNITHHTESTPASVSYLPPPHRQTPASQVRFHQTRSPPPNNQPSRINNYNPAYNSRFSSTGRTPLEVNITCSFCQRRGHTYSDCLKRKNTPFCINCKRYGHDVRDCRNSRQVPEVGPRRGNPNPPIQDQRNTSGPRVYNVRLKCDFCGRKGHDVETCAQKRKWEAKSQGNDRKSTQNSPARL